MSYVNKSGPKRVLFEKNIVPLRHNDKRHIFLNGYEEE